MINSSDIGIINFKQEIVDEIVVIIHRNFIDRLVIEIFKFRLLFLLYRWNIDSEKDAGRNHECSNDNVDNFSNISIRKYHVHSPPLLKKKYRRNCGNFLSKLRKLDQKSP